MRYKTPYLLVSITYTSIYWGLSSTQPDPVPDSDSDTDSSVFFVSISCNSMVQSW